MANNFDFLPNHFKSTHIKKQKKEKMNKRKERKTKRQENYSKLVCRN